MCANEATSSKKAGLPAAKSSAPPRATEAWLSNFEMDLAYDLGLDFDLDSNMDLDLDLELDLEYDLCRVTIFWQHDVTKQRLN